MSIEDNLKKLEEKLKIIEDDLKNSRKKIDDLDQQLTRRINLLESQLKKINQINKPDFDLEKLWHLHHFNPSDKKTHQTKIIE